PWSASRGRGLLAPLERVNVPRDYPGVAWLQAAAPFATNVGWPTQSQVTAQSWGGPAPGESNLNSGELAPRSVLGTSVRPESLAAATNVSQPIQASPLAFQAGSRPPQPGDPITQDRPDDRRGILTRMYDGAEAGAGGGEFGISRENIEKY